MSIENGDISPTLRSQMKHHEPTIFCVRERCGCEGGGKGLLIQEDKSGTVATNNDQFLCIALDRAAYNQGKNAKFNIGVDETGGAFTVIAKGPGAVCFALQRSDEYKQSEVASTQSARQYKNATDIVLIPAEIVLRRLTPTECARLQGMPDWWCDDVPHSDSAEYKMWGNGMALPCVMYVMEGIAQKLKEMNDND